MRDPSTPSYPRMRVPFFLLLLLPVLSGVFMQAFPVRDAPAMGPPGKVILAVDARHADAGMDGLLSSLGFGTPLSAFNARVEVSFFGPLRKVAAGDFLATLPPGDPRDTAWLRNQAEAFRDRSGRWSLWYLDSAKADAPHLDRLASELSARGLAEGADWMLPGSGADVPFPLGGVVWCVAVLLLAMVAPSGKPALVLAGVAALPGAWGLSLPPVLLMVCAMTGFGGLLELVMPALRRQVNDEHNGMLPWDAAFGSPEGRKSRHAFALRTDPKALAVRWAATVFFLVAAVFASAWCGGLLACGGMALAISGTGAFWIPLRGRMWQIRKDVLEHRPFVPIPIMSRSNPLHSRMRAAVPFLAVLFIIAVPASLVLAGRGSDGQGGWFPSWEADAGKGPADAWPAGRDPRAGRDGIPDMGDYLAHMAWQESLPWLDTGQRAVWRVPPAGSALTREVYTLSGTRVTGSAPEVVRFDAAWLDKALSPGDGAGLESILAPGGTPGHLVYRPSGRIYSSPDWLLASAILAGILLAVLWFRGRHASNRQWHDVGISFNQVRKQAV